jgi:hypothetical protein
LQHTRFAQQLEKSESAELASEISAARKAAPGEALGRDRIEIRSIFGTRAMRRKRLKGSFYSCILAE